VIVPVFAALVTEKGTLKFGASSRRALDTWLSTLAGKSVVVTVKQERATRSSQANRYYWGVVVPLIAEHLGYTNDEMHEALKYKFLRTEAECAASDLPKIRSSAALSTKEFGEYVDSVVTWAGADFGLNIPAPNEADTAA
jgi:hypothetical protein